jgi:hypothetical protein
MAAPSVRDTVPSHRPDPSSEQARVLLLLLLHGAVYRTYGCVSPLLTIIRPRGEHAESAARAQEACRRSRPQEACCCRCCCLSGSSSSCGRRPFFLSPSPRTRPSSKRPRSQPPKAHRLRFVIAMGMADTSVAP